MKTLLKTFIFLVGLSVFAFTASAHCGSCEAEPKSDHHTHATEHKEDKNYHKADDGAKDKTCTPDKDRHNNDDHHEDESHDEEHH